MADGRRTDHRTASVTIEVPGAPIRDAPTGLIVGRFDPPHLGHSYMIEWAAARVDRLVVYVNSRASDAVDGSLRAGWLAELHPGVTVIEVRHDLDTDFDDEGLWARWIELFRSRWPYDDGPHVVFSSDHYVGGLADRLGAAAVVVDADRNAVPVSATMVRASPAAHLHQLAPPVRAWVTTNWLQDDRGRRT
jgi:HTH-type transcriptional regulator, transcriptional repressor of NAD biosynthesis genes